MSITPFPFWVLAGILLCMNAPAQSAESPEGVARLAEVRDVLRRTPLIDGHNDLPWQYRKFTNNLDAFNLRGDASGPPANLVTDFPRLRQGGVGGQFWAVYVPGTLPGPEAVQTALEQFDMVHRMVRRYSDATELALTAADIRRIHHEGRLASLIGVEGGHAINNSLAVLRMFHSLGARYLTLTHVKNNDWADAAGDVARHHGLTAFGGDVIRELNRLGMMVDLSHVTDDVMRQALQISQAPVVFTHSSARALCDHLRNVPDDILRQVKLNKGLVMVCFLPGYLNNASAAHFNAAVTERARLTREFSDSAKVEQELEKWRALHPSPKATIQDVADHLDHLCKVVGVDHVGIGSDFEGFHGSVEGLEDVSKYPMLLAEMLRRGYTPADIEKIAGGNMLRVFAEVEIVGKRLQAARTP
jgi:membrane dipeptidase